MRRWPLVATAVALAGGALALVGCKTTYERRDPTGEPFPSVRGESLDGREVRIPEDLAGKPALLLVGYEQSTQFDLDRWILGLRTTGTDVAVIEVPTIPGLLPGAFGGYIDAGMRRGIPEEDWASVVTVYGDASDIAAFTGNRDGLPGRIVLLDAQGRVAFFHDRGYSAGTLDRLRATLAALR